MDMRIRNLRLLLIAATALGCSTATLSGTLAAFAYPGQPATEMFP